MKILKLSFLLFLLSSTFALGQADEVFQKSTKTVIDDFLNLDSPPLEGNLFKILLHLKFGGAEVINVQDIPLLNLGTIKEVKLYYSDFPKKKSFDQLNKDRVKYLFQFINPEQHKDIKWTLVKQKECNSYGEAIKLFHGFEVIMEYSEEHKLTAIQIDSSFQDFVVEKVLERNGWKEMLIVTDLTGSMYPYASQLFLWLKLNTIDDRIKQFVFFNDGDTNLNENKKIGDTGGIYHTKSKSYDEVERIATQCMVSGNGGDIPENDIEAMLRGIKLCPDCKENILIADNSAPVRDLELLKKLDRPVRVILCGGSAYINPEYLNLARATKGSIHLIEEDIFELMNINEGESIEINGTEYIIEKNRFTEVKRM